MADFNPDPRLKIILNALLRHDVAFIVIGGQAEVLMGGSRYTEDVDVCYRRDEKNLQNLAAALKALDVRLRNVPREVKFLVDARTLKAGSNFTFEAGEVSFDILGYVEPIGEYDDVLQNASDFVSPIGKFPVISLEDLIRIKEHLKRPKDGESLLQLYAIRRLRAGQK